MWANALHVALKRLWPFGSPASYQNCPKTSAVACPTALSMRRAQLRAGKPQSDLARLQSLRAQIVTTHKNNPVRAMLESQARVSVKAIFSEGKRK